VVNVTQMAAVDKMRIKGRIGTSEWPIPSRAQPGVSTMTDLILHSYDASPFTQRVLKMLAIKSVEWRSVTTPMMPPKDDLLALTGGYRGTPVLQIGADIYIDSQRIARELEERVPLPSLFPVDRPACSTSIPGRCPGSRGQPRPAQTRSMRHSPAWPRGRSASPISARASAGNARRRRHSPSRVSRPSPCAIDPDDAQGLKAGMTVEVMPDDTKRGTVRGTVAGASVNEITVRRQHPKCGEVVVHFPRLGYRVMRID
jgi:hypothetical protein